MFQSYRARVALFGSFLWLFPAAAFILWYGTDSTPVVPASWIRDALGLLIAGLGAWVLLLVVIYRGRLPYTGWAVGAAFVAMNVAVDVLLHTPGSTARLEAHLLDMLPTYVALGAVCVIPAWAVQRLSRPQASGPQAAQAAQTTPV
jgi:hypothetical protein